MAKMDIFAMTDTWNASGTTFDAIKMNVTDTASAAGSLLMNLQVGGTSQFSVRKDGRVFASLIGNDPTFGTNPAAIFFSGASAIFYISGGELGRFTTTGLSLSSSARLDWNSDTILTRDAADTLALRRDTNPQTFRIYRTYSGAGANYERLSISSDASAHRIVGERAGTGSNRALHLEGGGNVLGLGRAADGNVNWTINSGHFLAGTDNSFDIGASGANRPRDIFVARNVWADGNVTGGQNSARVGIGGVVAASSVSISFSGTTGADGSVDVSLVRDAADTLALRRTTNAQTFRVYNTTDGTNSSFLALRAVATSSFDILASSVGTGSTLPLRFGINNSAQWQINTSGHFTTVTDNTYDIGASGANRPRSLFVGADVRLGNSGTLYWGTTGSQIYGGTNGVLQLSNSAGNDFNRLQFGGTTNAFPALRRNAAALEVVVADNSAWATLAAGPIQANGNLTFSADNTFDIGASGANRPRAIYLASTGDAITSAGDIRMAVQKQLYWASSGGITAISDGVFRVVDNAGTSFNRLQFGGATSSFPALKRNSTALETRLADDSAYAPHAMQYLDVTDGVTAPAAATGRARIYVDTADGDLKVIFADGTIKTIVTDT